MSSTGADRQLMQINADQRHRRIISIEDPLGRRAIMTQDIPGTTMFDGDQAQKGLALNRMCFSFNSAENRAAFLRDEEAYCTKYGLTDEQRAAVKSRNVLRMIETGGNVYYLAKLAGIFGLNVQDIGAQQTNTTVDEFKAKLVAAGR
jgi:protocatechuate 4,5-dioxygenase alpha chain